MTDTAKNDLTREFQLELFTSTKQLNLSEIYETIPKEVSPDDPAIEWESENIALPIEKTFSSPEGLTLISEIKPPTLRNRKTKKYQTHFPYFRELRVEYAIISLASKENWLSVDYTREKGSPSYLLKTTIYRIQKEIVEAINAQEGKNLKVNECPYNTTHIREALNILKETNYSVRRADSGEKEYSFTRIKDLWRDGNNLVIELGTMISDYITRGEWNVVDSQYLLSSKTYYILKLRTLLHLKFRYARKGAFYNIAISHLMEKIGFKPYEAMRENVRKLTKILEGLPEVASVQVIPKKEGRKLVGAVFHIFPSEEFVQAIIDTNRLRKRVETAVLDDDQLELLLEPLESDYPSRKEYEAAKREYEVKRGKAAYRTRHSRNP